MKRPKRLPSSALPRSHRRALEHQPRRSGRGSGASFSVALGDALAMPVEGPKLPEPTSKK